MAVMAGTDAGEAAARGPLVVAIGASNLSRGLAGLVTTVRRRRIGSDILVAAGHGRSFGVTSRVAWRRLPSILGCGLWRAIDRLNPAGDRPVVAIVTDIGNDLLYGFSVEQTADWVRGCIARLAERAASVAVTGLPLESVARAGPLRYRLLKTVYVPGCSLTLEQLQSAARRLDDAVRGIAAESSATVIEQPGEWYGLDSIHVRRRRLDELWEQAATAWGMAGSAAPARRSLGDWSRIGTRAAEIRSLAGGVRFTRQPVVHWPDGTTLSLY
jgi:hypothetical protein